MPTASQFQEERTLEGIIEQTKKIISSQLDLGIDEQRLDADTLLFDDGIELDSFAIVELISLLEEQYDIEFQEAHFREEHFLSISTLAKLVNDYIARKALSSQEPNPNQ